MGRRYHTSRLFPSGVTGNRQQRVFGTGYERRSLETREKKNNRQSTQGGGREGRETRQVNYKTRLDKCFKIRTSVDKRNLSFFVKKD